MIDCKPSVCRIIYDEDDLYYMELESGRESCLKNKDSVMFEHDGGYYAVVVR